MRVLGQCLTSLLVAASTASVVEGFAPTPSFVVTTRRSIASAGTTTSQSSSFNTVLYISSWGTTKSGDSTPSSSGSDVENKNPEENVQAYLKAPDAVEARDNVDGTVLVSGLVRTSDRTDQFIFDLLNHEESAFEFKQIIAFVDDEKFAKKRLLSRSARYGGLLNKLNFIEADSSSPGSGSLPTSQQLEGVKSWVAYLEGDNILTEMEQVATTAKGVVGLENVAILMTNAIELDVDATKAAIEALKDSGVQYTVVAVGKLEDHAEGQIPYKYAELGTTEGVLSSDAIFSRNEALRMVTECLQLECGVNKAWAFSEVYDVNATEAKLIKGLRVAGYARPQEIDFMMRDGPTVSFILFCFALCFGWMSSPLCFQLSLLVYVPSTIICLTHFFINLFFVSQNNNNNKKHRIIKPRLMNLRKRIRITPKDI